MTELEILDREIASTALYLAKLRRARLEVARHENMLKMGNSPRARAIQAAYCNRQTTVAEVAERFATSTGQIQRMARQLGWPRRNPAACNGQHWRRRREQEAIRPVP